MFSDALDTELVQLVKERMIGVKFRPQDISEAFGKEPVRPEFEEIGQYIGQIEF